MIYGLGPRARRVYTVLRDRITRGDLVPGAKLPSHRELALEFGVAPLTVRQVLAELEDRGLVSRQVGRGTFVREVGGAAVLVLEPSAQLAAFLSDYVHQAGLRAATAADGAEAAAFLSQDPEVVLVLAEVGLARPGDGVAVIRSIRSRWPQLPIAALVDDVRQLADLFGTAEWPIHVLPKPVNLGQLDELLRLVARRPAPIDPAC
jgi:DNA-binding FadR family transcriptional regulator